MASALRITRCVGRNARFSKSNSSKSDNLLKTCDEAMAPTRSVIEGLSWRKLSADALQFSHSHLRKARKWGKTRKSSEADDCPLTERRMNTPKSERPPKKASSAAASPCGKRVMRKATTLTRMKSVMVKQKEALNTLKQKLHLPLRPRHKRLLGASPCPYTRSLVSETPSSVCRRRSVRLADQLHSGHDVQMYSPFCIVTPASRTPNKIRMGIHEPKRFNFSSPGQLSRDVDSVAVGIKALTDNGDSLTGAMERKRRPSGASHIRTTPGGRTPTRTRTTKHVFV